MLGLPVLIDERMPRGLVVLGKVFKGPDPKPSEKKKPKKGAKS